MDRSTLKIMKAGGNSAESSMLEDAIGIIKDKSVVGNQFKDKF